MNEVSAEAEAAAKRSSRNLEVLRPRLERWLAQQLSGGSAPRIARVESPKSSGMSSETLLFDASWTEAGAPRDGAYVARLAPDPADLPVFPVYDLAQQFRLLRLLRERSRVPVPVARWLEEDASVLGAPFFVMERVEGRIPTDNPPYHAGGWMTEIAPAERAAIWESGLDTLAAIHRQDPVALGIDFLDAPPAGADTVGWQLEFWQRYYRWVAGDRAFATLEAAYAWLLARRPPPTLQRDLCWGDSRIGNMIFDGGRCVAVLDWEMATLGPAEMDLGWFLLLDRHHCEGLDVPRLAGFPKRAASIARWETGAGRRAEHVEFWEAFAAWRFGVIMARVAEQMQHYEILPAESNFAVDNTMSRLLARMLALPAPA